MRPPQAAIKARSVTNKIVRFMMIQPLPQAGAKGQVRFRKALQGTMNQTQQFMGNAAGGTPNGVAIVLKIGQIEAGAI